MDIGMVGLGRMGGNMSRRLLRGGHRVVGWATDAAAVAALAADGGVGAVAAANKMPGVLAGLCHDTYSAHQGVEHDQMNVLALGARVVGEALAVEIAQAFVAARFDGVARHLRRVEKVWALEARLRQG